MAEETKNTVTTNNDAVNQQAETKTKADSTEKKQDSDAPSVENLMAEIAKMKAEAEKNKLALDKAMKERGDAVKALRGRSQARAGRGAQPICERPRTIQSAYSCGKAVSDAGHGSRDG